ncbi:MAG TPA: hypothetical protein VND45_15500 [Thermoanaerobaculia bacterium]|nr:hypothetical protein [Thermoanaerobaculia bacterium]
MPRLRLIVTAALLATLPAAAAPRHGIAFHYATPLSAQQLEWYSRFEVLVTHDPLPRAQADALRRAGTKLALYEWSVAYYEALKTPWHTRLPSSALLNATPLRGHLGAADADAYYYDPATREHMRDRAVMLARRLRAVGYDGVFFDTTTSASVHPDALREYERRHPELPYDAAFARFLTTLRQEMRGGIIITNQGYRAANDVLPYTDWDVTESLITWPRGGHFVLRPWNDSADAWNSTNFLMRHLIAPVRARYPRVRYAHINYLDAPEPRRVAEIVAISLLFDAHPVIATRDAATTIPSELLLLDLGRPGALHDAYRFFEHGFVAYNALPAPLRVPSEAVYEDAVTHERVTGTIVVPPRAARILRRIR